MEGSLVLTLFSEKVMMKRSVLLCGIFFLFIFSGISLGNVVFLMKFDSAVGGQKTLEVGQEAVMQIFAKFDTPRQAGNGIVSWEMDLLLDVAEAGPVGIKTQSGQAAVNIHAPNQDVLSSGLLFPNSPVVGAGEGLGVFSVMPSSNVGVGQDFQLIAEVTLVALEIGTVTYELGNFSVGAKNGSGNENVDGIFDDEMSDATVVVVPEPSSLMLLAGLSTLFVRRKQS